MAAAIRSSVKPSSASGGTWPWRRKPSKFGLVSINEAYMSDLRKPKLIRPTDADRRQASVHRPAA